MRAKLFFSFIKVRNMGVGFMNMNASEYIRRNKQIFIHSFHKPQTKYSHNLLKQVQYKE